MTFGNAIAGVKGFVSRPVDVRFEEKYIPEPNSGCWLWIGGLIPNGYGIFRAADNTKILAHRFSYERERGMIPEGMQIDHLCRVRCCVNPDHMEVVTNRENCRRGGLVHGYRWTSKPRRKRSVN